MKHFRNYMLLFLFSLGSLVLLPYETVHITISLSGLIFSCLNYYLDHNRFRAASIFLCAAGCLLHPACLVLAPLMVYAGMALLPGRWSFQVFAPAAAIGLILSLSQSEMPVPAVLFLVCGCIFSAVLYMDAVQFHSLRSEYTSSQDNAVFKNLSLSEYNKNLLEKQDYEIYTATLKERSRIAREIHDNVGHLLSRAIVMTGAIRTISSEDALAEPLLLLEETLHHSMDSIRKSVHDMHDDSISLREASRQLLSSFTFCPVSVSYDIKEDIPVPVKYCFLSVLKESLANIIRHSNATQVSVTIREHPGLYQLCIEDNGTCIKTPAVDPDRVSDTDPDSGIGLYNMKERVRKLNGNFTLQTTAGFRIFITIPKEPA